MKCDKYNSNMTLLRSMSKGTHGFTIVELLVVIIVIGILAAIIVVSYTGISQKAVIASIKSDLANSAKKLKLHLIQYSSYADTINCSAIDSATNLCLRPSGNNEFTYTPDNSTSPPTFYLEVRNGDQCYSISDNTAIGNCINIQVQIGSQIWMNKNLNVGTMINSSVSQSNNGIIEKYCYNNLESNCTTYGGIYQWGEIVQYLNGASNTTSPNPAFSGNVRGICPSGWHFPTNNEWKTLEISLGMTQAEADGMEWRGTDQGAQLKNGGSSGFNALYAGFSNSIGGTYAGLGSETIFAVNTESGQSSSFERILHSSYNQIAIDVSLKANGRSVRCLKD